TVAHVLRESPGAGRSVGSIVAAALTRTRRGLVSELVLSTEEDGVPTDCVVNFDHVHALPRPTFRRWVTQLSARRMTHVCQTSAADGHKQAPADDRLGHRAATGRDRIS